VSHKGAHIPERRLKRRFQIEQPVRYKLLYGQRIGETGTGRTVDISSSGVRILTEQQLAVGLPLEIAMQWPALLNQVCPMKLMIFGCVLRSEDHIAAVSIDRYEFRTMGSTKLTNTPALPAEPVSAQSELQG